MLQVTCKQSTIKYTEYADFRVLKVALVLLVALLSFAQASVQVANFHDGHPNALHQYEDRHIIGKSRFTGRFQLVDDDSTLSAGSKSSKSDNSMNQKDIAIESKLARSHTDDLRSYMLPTLAGDDIFQSDDTVARSCKLLGSPKSASFQDESHLTLVCSSFDDDDYFQVINSFDKNENLTLDKIYLNDGELNVVSALKTICDKMNCSNLSLLSITDYDIQDYKLLGALLSTWPQLNILVLSGTMMQSLSPLFAEGTSYNISTLILDNNNISTFDMDALFKHMPKLRLISMTNNTLSTVNVSDEAASDKLIEQLDLFMLAGNNITCDKSNLWLMKHFLDTSATSKFPNSDKINCSSPERLQEMTWAQRVSVLDTPICATCDCRSLKKTAMSVECHNRNLTLLPEVLPINTKVLNFTNNRIAKFGLPTNSKNWDNVTYVYLENNLITEFQSPEFNSKFMRNLAALDIRRNKFQDFPSHIFEQFTNLDQVHLSNNPWVCDCETTFAFQEWLQRQFQKVGDKEDIKCGMAGSDENGYKSLKTEQRLSARIIYRLSKSELCPQEQEEHYDMLDVLNLCLSFSIIFIVLKVTLDYVYQHRTKRLPKFFKLNY